jgi:hypothetical protein
VSRRSKLSGKRGLAEGDELLQGFGASQWQTNFYYGSLSTDLLSTSLSAAAVSCWLAPAEGKGAVVEPERAKKQKSEKGFVMVLREREEILPKLASWTGRATGHGQVGRVQFSDAYLIKKTRQEVSKF